MTDHVAALRALAPTLTAAAERLRYLEHVEQWARDALALDYTVGNVVHLHDPPHPATLGHGWRPYAEMLTSRDTQGTVTSITFNPYAGYWTAGVRFDTGWSTSLWADGPRVYPFTRPKVFALDVARLRRVPDTDVDLINVRPGSAS